MAGFTLLEVVVAVAILGLLLVGLTQESRFALFSWDMHAQLMERNANLDAVDRTLRRLIEQASPGSKWEPLAFAGTARTITFTSVMPIPTGVLPTQRVDVELMVDSAHRLLLVSTPHLHAVRNGRPPQPMVTEILQGIDRLELSYLPAGQSETWTRVWREAVPPRLVRVGIVFSDAHRPTWPGIVIAPMLDSPG